MKHKNNWIARALVTVLGGSIALAADVPTPSPLPARAPNVAGDKPLIGDDAAVLPFLQDDVIFVVRIDPPAIDMKAMGDWTLSAIDSMSLEAPEKTATKAAITEKLATASDWLKKFRDAGGKKLYWIGSFEELATPFIVAPIEPGVDAKGLAAVFDETSTREHAVVMGNAIVFARDATHARLKKTGAAGPKRYFAEAMSAAGDAPVRAVLIPPNTLRRFFDANLPTLPDELGGGKTSTLTQGFRWAAVGLTPPPQAALKIIIQAEDADYAKEVEKVIQGTADWAEKNPEDGMNTKLLFALLKPRVEDSRLVTSLDAAKMQELATGVILPQFIHSRRSLSTFTTIITMREVLRGCQSYANQNIGKWPDSLDPLAPFVEKSTLEKIKAGIPRGGRTPHYVYLKPASPINRADEVIVMYEAFENDAVAEVVVGFADNHVVTMPLAELKKGLTNKVNSEK